MPFSLQNHSEEHRKKILDKITGDVSDWKNGTEKFVREYHEYAQSYRIRPKDDGSRRSNGLSNTKSGETHRATETLATLWMRMLTASDPFFQMYARGLDPYGMKIREQDIYAAEQVQIEQHRRLKFKPELLRSLTSVSLFGSGIYELTWERLLNLDGMNWFEGTKLRPRSLLTTGFDVSGYDITESDFVFTIDYLTKHKIRALVSNEPENWDRAKVEELIKDDDGKQSNNFSTEVYAEVEKRRQRAGYQSDSKGLHELITYYGKLDIENPIIQEYWASNGFTGDPRDYDFCVRVLDGKEIVYFGHAPYGNKWSKFKTAHYKQFELEPLAYGVGALGARTQKDLDISLSRASDTLLFASYGMYKLGRYAGLKPSQLQIKPRQILEMDDITQLEQLKVDLNTVAMAMNFQGVLREEIRANTGATANLQAISTGGTATESTLTQNEAMRSGSVHAEIIAETLLREVIEQSHINNIHYLDAPIWVSISGEPAPKQITKHNLPMNLGVDIKLTTDKDFRPERNKKLLEMLQMLTSIRNDVPSSVNAIMPTFEELFRSMGMNPRLLYQVNPVGQEMAAMMQNRAGSNQPNMSAEVDAEIAQEMGGGNSSISTPMGLVPTSPQQQLSSGDMSI